MGKDGGPFTPDRILLRIHFWSFALAILALPSLSLAICFFTAYFFRFDDVNVTMCEVDGIPPPELVQNSVPSVSAVTGITPQAYLWRLCIALHCTPRLCVSFIHYNHYQQRLARVSPGRLGLYHVLVRLNFWLSVVENAMLICVTFISNRENYPVHEKLFIVFMVTSLTYMLCNIFCFTMVCQSPKTKDEERSYFWKRVLFATSITATAGLIYFYMRHRLLCEPGAFSMFSVCEYVIAYAAMAYHFTAYIDFKNMFWLVASPVSQPGSGADNNNVNVCRPASAAETSAASAASSAASSASLDSSHDARDSLPTDGLTLRSRKLS